MLSTLIAQRGIENFLPLKKVRRNHRGKKKWVDEPLIHSYIFVRVGPKEYHQPLYLPGAVRYICFDGKAVPIPDQQIDTLKQLVYHMPLDLQVTCEQLNPGEMVEICRGPMIGVCGELIQIRGNHRLLLRLNSLGVCVHVEVGLEDIKPLYETIM
jgi:transcriptional antiterminator RfaH